MVLYVRWLLKDNYKLSTISTEVKMKDIINCISFKTKNIILNPVENLPMEFGDESISQLQGLYITDKNRAEEQKKNSKILFAGRDNYINSVISTYELWKTKLKAQDITMRPQSGLNAHLLIFLGLGNIGDKVMLLPEEAGGHFSTHKILTRIGYNVIPIPIDFQNKCVDIEKAIKIQRKEKCDFLFVDRSEGLEYEDFSELCRNFDGYKIFDASQYLSNIIFNQFKSPFDMGFDLIISTLHKNFPGPQKALICTKDKNSIEWQNIMQTMYDCVSNIHADKILQAGLILQNPLIKEYSNDILVNAIRLEKALSDFNVPVVTRNYNEPNTHHIWIPFIDKEQAYNAYKILEHNGILTNYRQLPYDIGYGLRVGTNCATIQGLNENNIKQLAYFFSQSINGKDNQEEIHRFISDMTHDSKYMNNKLK